MTSFKLGNRIVTKSWDYSPAFCVCTWHGMCVTNEFTDPMGYGMVCVVWDDNTLERAPAEYFDYCKAERINPRFSRIQTDSLELDREQ